MGGSDEIEQEKAARRFAIGHLADWIKTMDPKGRAHSKHVIALASALFPRDDVPELDEKEVGEYRATAAKSGLSRELWDV